MADSKICVDIFSWDDQIRVCKRIIKLLKAQKGSVAFGRQIGNVKGQEIEHTARDGGKIWQHDTSSFGRMWDQAGKETGTSWKTWAELYEMDKGQTWAVDGSKMLRFEVQRVA